jgi:hypothetical protein
MEPSQVVSTLNSEQEKKRKKLTNQQGTREVNDLWH